MKIMRGVSSIFEPEGGGRRITSSEKRPILTDDECTIISRVLNECKFTDSTVTYSHGFDTELEKSRAQTDMICITTEGATYPTFVLGHYTNDESSNNEKIYSIIAKTLSYHLNGPRLWRPGYVYTYSISHERRVYPNFSIEEDTRRGRVYICYCGTRILLMDNAWYSYVPIDVVKRYNLYKYGTAELTAELAKYIVNILNNR